MSHAAVYNIHDVDVGDAYCINTGMLQSSVCGQPSTVNVNVTKTRDLKYREL